MGKPDARTLEAAFPWVTSEERLSWTMTSKAGDFGGERAAVEGIRRTYTDVFGGEDNGPGPASPAKQYATSRLNCGDVTDPSEMVKVIADPMQVDADNCCWARSVRQTTDFCYNAFEHSTTTVMVSLPGGTGTM